MLYLFIFFFLRCVSACCAVLRGWLCFFFVLSVLDNLSLCPLCCLLVVFGFVLLFCFILFRYCLSPISRMSSLLVLLHLALIHMVYLFFYYFFIHVVYFLFFYICCFFFGFFFGFFFCPRSEDRQTICINCSIFFLKYSYQICVLFFLFVLYASHMKLFLFFGPFFGFIGFLFLFFCFVLIFCFFNTKCRKFLIFS